MKNKNSTLLGLILLLFLSGSLAQAQGTHKAVPLGSSAAPYGFYEYLPTNFSKSSGKYPLLVFLHGAGEKGNGKDQLSRAIKFGPGREVERGKNLPFVILSPQTDYWWDSNKLNDLINLAIKNYNIDPNRIYMTGLSMGAMGTFNFAASYPNKLAAMVGIAGKADNSKACQYSHVPLWAFHGDADPTVHVSGSKTLVEAYNKCNPSPNPKAKLTILAGYAHWGWNEVYDGSRGDIYNWMLQYSKNGADEEPAPQENKAPVVSAGSNKSVTLPLQTLSISGSAKDEDGSISSYAWRKVSGPGVEMNNANTATLKLSKLEKGNYVFRLTARDNSGASASDEMNLEVKAEAVSNSEITAYAGGDRTIRLPVEKKVLSGSAKLVGSRIRSYKWEKVSGPSVKMNGANTANLILTQLSEGEYTFRFTATNYAGKSDSDEMKLKVLKRSGSSGSGENSVPTPEDSEQGLIFSYYEFSSGNPWKKLPDFRTLKPVKTGKVRSFSLSPRKRDNYFAFVYEGYIKIAQSGKYFFYTHTDDGSKLYINDKLVVNNDGVHAPEVKYNSVELKSGYNKIRLEYFERTGRERLYVSYKGPGVGLQEVPKNLLSTGIKAGAGSERNSSGGLSYAYYENNDSRNRWYKLPDFNRISPVKSGTVGGFTLAPAQRSSHYALVFEGQIKIEKGGAYTFFTNSDDGSQLFINGTRVVDNDGWHAPQERSGKINLSAGNHAIRVVFYEHEGGEMLEVKWQGPGISKQLIPSSVLTPGAYSATQSAIARNTRLEAGVEPSPGSAPKLYPNPAKDHLTVDLGDIGKEAVWVTILDLSGRQVYQGNFRTVGSGSMHLSLESIGLKKGAYLMKVRGDQPNTFKAFRFIKE